MQIYSAEKDIADLLQDELVTCELKVESSPDDKLVALLHKSAATASENMLEEEDDEEDDKSESLVEELAPSPQYIQNNRDIAWWPAILVTSNWNKNDDVFTPVEMAKGSKTPLLKPVNWMHKIGKGNNEVIGVMNSAVLVDEFYNEVEPESVVNDDHKLHIAVGMVIWTKLFPSYSADIQKGLKDGKMFVSMECWVSNFGYALRPPNSDQIILLDRDEKTAGLTKYLKWVKGPGVVKINGLEYRIGRWIKNPLFAAVGCVYKPANDESVPLLDNLISTDKSLFKMVASTDFEESGVLLIDSDNKGDNIMKDDMKEDKAVCSCATVKAELEAAKAALASAKAEAESAKAEAVAAKAALETAQAEQAATAGKMKEWEAKASAVESQVAILTSEVEKAQAAKIEVENKYNEIHKREVGRTRVAQIRDYVAIEDENKSIAEFGEMSEAEFNVAIKYATAAAGGVKKMTDQTVSNKPKMTDQTVSNCKKLTDHVAKASENKDESAIAETVVTAAASTETLAQLGERLGRQLAENYTKKRS